MNCLTRDWRITWPSLPPLSSYTSSIFGAPENGQSTKPRRRYTTPAFSHEIRLPLSSTNTNLPCPTSRACQIAGIILSRNWGLLSAGSGPGIQSAMSRFAPLFGGSGVKFTAREMEEVEDVHLRYDWVSNMLGLYRTMAGD